MYTMIALVLLFCCISNGKICPLMPSNLALTHPGYTGAPYCNVSILGGHLCACFGNDHCTSSSCGCLVPSGTCTKDSCAFPRVCFCGMIGDSDSEGANCSPVNSGPCHICHPNNTAITSKKVHTPAKLLRDEFKLLGEVELRERALRVHLKAEGTLDQVIDRLVNHVIEMELQKQR